MGLRHLATVIGMLGILLAGCAANQAAVSQAEIDDRWGAVQVAPGETIRIAVATTSSGGMGVAGVEHLRGAELAVARRGAIRGFPVEIVPFEAGCTPEEGTRAAEAITQDSSLVAVVGPACSPSCEAAAPLLDAAHTTAVSPACSASALTDQVAHIGAFMRTMVDGALEADLAARFAYTELGARQVVVIDDGTLETQPLAGAFSARFAEQGGRVTSAASITPGEANFHPLFQSLAPGAPDLIYAPLRPEDGARLAIQVRASALAGTPLLGGRHYVSEWFVQEAGVGSQGTLAVGPLIETQAFEEARQAYLRRYRQEPQSPDFAFGYDATALTLRAIEEAAVITPERAMLIGREALRSALYRTATHPGLTGSLTCTGQGDCSAGALAVWQIQQNEWNPVYVP